MWAFAATAFVSYVASSFFLLKRPNFIFRRKPCRFRCRHISHRGGAGENLENTMAAFRHAVKVGTDMLELDCQLTADGQVVVAHDNSLLRICDVDAQISDLQYSQLPLIREALPLDFNKQWFVKASDRRIPLLREVFAEFPSIPVNVDIKVEDDALMHKVSDLVKEFDRESLTVWGNFKNSTCLKCLRVNPNIPMLFSSRRVAVLLLYFWTGLLPFMPIREQFLEIFMPSVFLDNPAVHLSLGLRGRLLLRILDFLLMRPSLFEHLSKRGIQTYCWVLNSPEEFKRAFDLGVTGVMTDFPTKLTEFFNDNPQFRRRLDSE